jgi:predicted branched-subunit amino acid permease
MTSDNAATFCAGTWATLPYQPAIIIFGLVSGAVMAEAGLSLFETLAMTLIVLGGASQLAAVQMLTEQTSVAVIVATCICINLRFGMYSAALAPWFSGMPSRTRLFAAYVVHDQSFGVALRRFKATEEDWRARMIFFLAAGGITALVWKVTTGLGHILGATLPEGLPLDFAMPMIFIAMVAPFLTGRPKWLAAVVATGAALVLRDLPLDLGLLVATGLGVGAGYWAEQSRADD